MVIEMTNNTKPFIKTRDKNTKEQLQKLGFILLTEQDGVFTFINDGTQQFSGNTNKVVFTDKLDF